MISHPAGMRPSDPGRASARTRWPRRTSSGARLRPRKPVAPVMKTFATYPSIRLPFGNGCVLFVFHHPLNVLQIALDLFSGIEDLAGIVDHARREEDDQFRAARAVALRPKRRTKNRNSVEHRNPTRTLRALFLND